MGLDLAATSLRAVQLRCHGDRLRLDAALEVRPSDHDSGPPDDLPDSPESAPSEQTDDHADRQLLEQLQRLVRHRAFRARQVVLHCPADRLDLRPLQLPCPPAGLSRETIIGTIKLQMKSQLPFPLDQTVFDYYPGSYDSNENLLTIMAVTADARWIKQRMDLVESVGLRCVRVDALPCALARLLPRDSADLVMSPDAPPDHDAAVLQPDALFAILDIALDSSTLIVRANLGPVFCRTFPFGGKTLTDIVTRQFPMDFQRAETLKLTHGLECSLSTPRRSAPAAHAAAALAEPLAAEGQSLPNARQPRIARSIYAAAKNELTDFAEALTRSLNYVINEHQASRLREVFLCGCAAHTHNLPEFLSEQFDFPVRCITHPLLDEITASLPPSRSCPGLWTTALGLALPQEVH